MSGPDGEKFESPEPKIEFSDIRRLNLIKFKRENLLSEDKISDWKKSGFLYYLFSAVFLGITGFLASKIFAQGFSFGGFDVILGGGAILSLIFAYFKRQEFYSEEVSRTDLMYHRFAKLIDLYYRDDYGRIKDIIRKIDGLNDLNFFIGGRTLPRDIIKGLRTYRKYLKKAERNDKLEEFVEETFEETIDYPTTYLGMTRERNFVKKIRGYAEDSIKGKSWSRHFSNPIEELANILTRLSVYEGLAIGIVVIAGILRHSGYDYISFLSLVLSVVIMLFKD